MTRFATFLILIGFAPSALLAETPDTVFLEELTSPEVRHAIDNGTTTIIVPTAGTEQNGSHVVLGKHKYRMNAGAERIARELGDTLVAPVMTYVPEGTIDPPSGHMRRAGTLSISQELFESLLEQTAKSLRAHGFTDILFIGDSGGNQAGMEAAAARLDQEWADEATRVHHISEWYFSSTFREWLLDQGHTEEELGRHAGLVDTSMLMAVTPEHIRTELMSVGTGMDIDGNGVNGDPSASTAEMGQVGMDFAHDAAMTQIRELMAADNGDN